MHLRQGQQIDRYVVEHLIGAGGMAEVWSVRHRVLGTRHALKLLLFSRTDHRRRLLQEGRAQARLDHPNLLPVRDVLSIGGQPALLLPLIAGPPLNALLGDYRPASEEALALFQAIAEGLRFAHEAGFIHRDLKPSNVLIDLNRGHIQPRIGDFGLVKVATEMDSLQTLSGATLGTPAYAAPEQLDDASNVDARADLFSLGVMFVELLTGARPFGGQTPRAIREAQQRPPTLLGVPAAHIDLAGAMLAFDPADRIASVEEVMRLLGDVSSTPLFRDGPLMQAVERLRRPPSGERPRSTASSTGSGSSISTIATIGLPTDNLPAARDPFIGREDAIQTLHELVQRGGRLITVTGFGGAGKTRLAIEYGRRFRERWPGGVWLIDLTDADTPETIGAAIAHALNVPLGRNPQQQLEDALRGRGRTLLLLDNFEQLVKHAAGTVGGWLDATREITFLVTSREPLRLRGEVLFPLQPLDEETALKLFMTRAQAARHDFSATEEETALLRELVQTLDGLPLAIELAAARSRTLSPAILHKRIGERFKLLTSRSQELPARQRTLRATIQWSWDLLHPWETSTMAQLSIFEGGFTFEDAEVVVDLSDHLSAPWLEDILAELVDKSLLSMTEGAWTQTPRFSLLMSVQDFARQQLTDPSALLARHGAHFSAMGTETGLSLLTRQGGAERTRALLESRDNIHAALRHALARKDADTVVNAGMLIQQIYTMRGPYQTGARLIRQARAALPLDEKQRGRLMRAEAWLRCRQGDHYIGLELLEQALEAHRAQGDRFNEARVLCGLGLLRQESQGRSAAAFADLNNALAIFQGLGARGMEALVRGNLGVVHDYQGDFAAAEDCYRQALAIHREVGSRRNAVVLYANLTSLLLQQGRDDEAIRHGRRGLKIAREDGDRTYEGILLINLGSIYLQQGRTAEARAHLEAALTINQDIGNRRFTANALGNLGELRATQGHHAEAATLLQEAIAICEEIHFNAAEGAFRGSLGLSQCHLGAFDAGRQNLERGEILLRASQHRVELGKLLCRRAMAARLYGEPDAADAYQQEAREIVAALALTPNAGLPRLLAQISPAVSPTVSPA
ncbi:MAG: tetratricopeptide repeat protein [Myxococcota bacterium]